jgi:hypothetical protein
MTTIGKTIQLRIAELERFKESKKLRSETLRVGKFDIKDAEVFFLDHLELVKRCQENTDFHYILGYLESIAAYYQSK